MVAKEKNRSDFSARLNLACDQAAVRAHGRAVDIEAALKKRSITATTTAIGKWLNGDAIPSAEKLRVLADWLEVRPEWLEYGVEPMRNRFDIAVAPQQGQQSSATLSSAPATTAIDPSFVASTPEEQTLLADFRRASPQSRRKARAVLLEEPQGQSIAGIGPGIQSVGEVQNRQILEDSRDSLVEEASTTIGEIMGSHEKERERQRREEQAKTDKKAQGDEESPEE